MKRIFKYELEVSDNQILEIPSNTILSIKEQNNKIVIYALVDTKIIPIKYEFGILGTGNPITFDINLFTFLDTVILYNGSLMFHIFYRKIE